MNRGCAGWETPFLEWVWGRAGALPAEWLQEHPVMGVHGTLLARGTDGRLHAITLGTQKVISRDHKSE